MCIYLHFLFCSLHCIFYNVIFLDYFNFQNPAATLVQKLHKPCLRVMMMMMIGVTKGGGDVDGDPETC